MSNKCESWAPAEAELRKWHKLLPSPGKLNQRVGLGDNFQGENQASF